MEKTIFLRTDHSPSYYDELNIKDCDNSHGVMEPPHNTFVCQSKTADVLTYKAPCGCILKRIRKSNGESFYAICELSQLLSEFSYNKE